MNQSVLIIDDSPDDQISYRRALRDTGWELLTASTLAAGLDLLKTRTPGVILLDYNLPDGDGLTFLRTLAQNSAGVLPAVIMLTGGGDEQVAVEAMKAGAVDYFVKDVSGSHLALLQWSIKRALNEHTLRLRNQKAEQHLRLAANVLLNITEGILVTDPEGCIVSANPAFCAISGYSEEELVGKNPRLIKSNRHDVAFYRAVWQSFSDEGCWQGDIWNRRKNGSLFLCRETITAIRDDKGQLQHYVAVLIDITDAKQTEEFIRHQAFHDALTNLPNRSLFMDRLRHQLAYATRQETSLAVVFLDLDGFKAVNDELGHHVGDELLKEAAERLKACARESDTVARLGGDEFTAILNDIDSPADAAAVAQKMIEQLQRPFRLGELERTISASIGLALCPADNKDAVVLLQLADEAMYASKRNGKGRFTFSSDA